MSSDKPPEQGTAPLAALLEKVASENSKSQWQRAGFVSCKWSTSTLLWIIALHVFNLFHAGPPLAAMKPTRWILQSMPTVGDIWHNLRNDISPPLFVAVARVWTLAWPDLGSDFNYRVLGFLIGMGTLAVIWWCARKIGKRAKRHTGSALLTLYGVNPIDITHWRRTPGGPYGLGIVLTLLAMTLIWNFVQTPGRKSLFWATLSAVLQLEAMPLSKNAFFIIAFLLCGVEL